MDLKPPSWMIWLLTTVICGLLVAAAYFH